MTKKIRRILFFSLSFFFARGVLFFSPILLANLLPLRTYGMVEWAYAAASLAATILGFGISSAIPLLEFKKTPSGTLAGVLMHYVCLVFGCILLLSVALLRADGDTLFLTTLFIATVALQSLWSVYLRTHGKGESSLFVDSGIFVLMVVTAAAAKYFHVADAMLWVLWTVAGYALVLYGITVASLMKCLRKGEALAYRAVLDLGFPLMIASLVTVAVATSGRLVIGYLGGVLLTADYAVLARASALPLVAHQVVMVAKFRHLFTLPDHEMERVLVLIFSMVALSVVAFGLFFPFFGWMLGPVFFKTFTAHPLPALWLLAQALLWSGIAAHDLINTRYHSTRKVLPWTLGFLLVSAPFAILLIQRIGVSLEHFVYVYGLWMLLFYINQIYAMYRTGIRLLRAWTLVIGSYVSIIVLASLWQGCFGFFTPRL